MVERRRPHSRNSGTEKSSLLVDGVVERWFVWSDVDSFSTLKELDIKKNYIETQDS